MRERKDKTGKSIFAKKNIEEKHIPKEPGHHL
jgi:hypothetical protein